MFEDTAGVLLCLVFSSWRSQFANIQSGEMGPAPGRYEFERALSAAALLAYSDRLTQYYHFLNYSVTQTV